MFKTKDDYDKFKIYIKGKIQKDGREIKNLTINKERISGEYFFLIILLLQYAATLSLEYNEEINRQTFLDMANDVWVNAVEEMNHYDE